MPFPVSSTLLDACVLAVLSKGDTYGYKLTLDLRHAVDLSESTLYPVLRRLQKDELLETYEKPFDGRNRKYYHITSQGKKRNDEYAHMWEVFKKNLDRLIAGEDNDEQRKLY